MGVILSYLYYKTDVLVSDDDGEIFSDVSAGDSKTESSRLMRRTSLLRKDA